MSSTKFVLEYAPYPILYMIERMNPDTQPPLSEEWRVASEKLRVRNKTWRVRNERLRVAYEPS